MNNSLIDIDSKINDIKSELDKLHRATELIPKYETDLKTLESAKLILVGTNGLKVIEVPIKRKRSKYTIGALTVKILEEEGRPLHVKEIVKKLMKRGKEANNLTVTGACLRLKSDGIVEKTYPNTFDLVNKVGL